VHDKNILLGCVAVFPKGI
jgi:hypothetical protein